MEMKEYILLEPLTKFHIGGLARYFVEVHTESDLCDAVSFANEQSLPIFILGGGSNVLVSDDGFLGVVIHMKNKNLEFIEDGTLVVVDAGFSWDALVEKCVLQNLFGLENLSGIPGSVGGAVIGNIGAYGSEVKKTVEWVETFDTRTLSLARFSNKECQFGYRESIFKREEGRNLIVVKTAFRLQKHADLDRSYKDISEYEKRVGLITTLTQMRKSILSIRALKFPENNTVGTAGSFFKNPVVDGLVANNFKLRFPDAPMFQLNDGKVKLSAAWIIDHVLNMRGVRDGNVGTWESQALVLINFGGAQAKEVSIFAKKIVDRCFNETGVTLTPEVIFVGDQS